MKQSPLQYFFWIVAGSEIHVLKDCSNDYNRHASIGFILFMTTLFASISGFSAGYFFSNGNITISFSFGLLWAMLIYSIDRIMVVSLKKQEAIDSLPFLDKAKHYSVPFLSRTVVGIMIGFFMSIPIEIIVFQDNIGLQIDAENKQKVLAELDFVNKKDDKEGKTSLKEGAENQKKEIDKLLVSDCPESDYKNNVQEFKNCLPAQTKLYNEYIAEYNKAAAIPKYIPNPNYEPNTNTSKLIINPAHVRAVSSYQGAYKNYKAQKSECDGYKSEYERIDRDWRSLKNIERRNADSISIAMANKITQISGEADSSTQNRSDILKHLNGFTRQYEALTHAASNKNNGSLFFLLWLIRLIFIGIEILPTLTKIMTPVGDYDRAIFYYESMFKEELKTDLETKLLTEELRKKNDTEIASKTEEIRRQQEIELNKTLISEVARVQTEIAMLHLSEWENREKASASNTINNFISSNT